MNYSSVPFLIIAQRRPLLSVGALAELPAICVVVLFCCSFVMIFLAQFLS